MMTRLCDRCGQPLEYGELRYVAKIQVFAAYDPLEIRAEDLQRDHSAEYEELLRQCEELTEKEAMRDVYAEFELDLCPACQRVYVNDPIPFAGG